MNSDILAVIGLLSLGYILLLLEIFVPGGILGVLGTLSILYGCYLALQISTAWGVSSVAISVVVTLLSIRLFFKSRMAKKLVLDPAASAGVRGWEDGLDGLMGQEGTTLSDLRPAGVAAFGDQRVDVVTDSEFLASGVQVRVVEVEGRRVVVEAVAEETEN